MIRVLLVDDHTLVRAGLKRLLEQTNEIEVTVADSGEAAVAIEAELKPDVVLMDVSMPGMSGIETTRRICARRKDASVVMLTSSTDRGNVIDSLDAGAIGYLIKDAEPATLIEGVRAAAQGEAPLDARAAKKLLDARSRRTTSLTERENEVLSLISDGLSNKAIARRLGISDKTVKSHLTKVFAELGVSDRTQAALWAREHLGSSDS